MSLIIIDQHGDLAELVLASLAAANVDPERVQFYDLANGSYLPSWNPLASKGEVHRLVSGVVGAIRRRAESWGVALEETIYSLSVALSESGYSLLEIDAALSNSGFRHQIRTTTKDPYALAFLDRFERLSDEQRRVQHLAVMNKLTPYVADPRMRRLLGTGSLDVIKQAVNTPGKIVLVSVPGYALGDLAGVLGEMLLGAIWNTILARASVPEKKRSLVRLIIDEFQLAAGDQFASMVTEGRRFGLSLVLAHQSQVQLNSNLRALIRNNSAVRLLLSPGVVDAGELATELSPMSHTEAVNELMALKTGEAFIVRRGEQATKILTKNVTPLTVPTEDIAIYKEKVLARSCRPVSEIDAELAQRAANIGSLANIVDRSENKKEVLRHERKPWR